MRVLVVKCRTVVGLGYTRGFWHEFPAHTGPRGVFGCAFAKFHEAPAQKGPASVQKTDAARVDPVLLDLHSRHVSYFENVTNA